MLKNNCTIPVSLLLNSGVAFLPRFLFLAFLILSPVHAVPRRGENLLVNSSFEKPQAEHAAGWKAYGNTGYTSETRIAQEGQAGIFCQARSEDDRAGAMQEVLFDPPRKHPFMVSGWSKCERVSGADYCLYMDVWYADGTNLWGQRRNFEGGTHDWQRIEFTFDVAKPVAKIQFFILLRHATGTAWFDNMSLSLVPFKIEARRVIPSAYGGNSIDFQGRLSLPGQWKAEVKRDRKSVYSVSGKGRAIVFSWPGRDTRNQLLPGGDFTVRITARDDLLGESLTDETSVRTRNGEGRGYLAWTESSMKRVLTTLLPVAVPEHLAASVSLAGNEYESFQVALRAAPGKELKNCTVELSELVRMQGAAGEKGDREKAVIPKSDIEWRQVGFVWLEQLRKHPYMTHATPGWWPDPLLPVSKFGVPGGTTQSIWFTIYARPGTGPGQYRGEFVIRPANAPAFRVQVRTTVYGFDIPWQPHIKTAFALMQGFLEKIYGRPLSPKLRRAYGDYLLRHRLNPDDISRTDLPDLEDYGHYDKQGLNAFNILNMVQERGQRPWLCWSPLSVYTPKFKKHLIERLDPYMAKLKHRGLDRKAYVYTFDERGKDFYPVMKEYFGLIKQRYGIPTLTTARIPQDPEIMKDLNVDWNCPLTPRYNFERADRCRAAGLEVWAYICLGPGYPYANWLADNPLIEARLLWWQAFEQKMDGFLYWGLNIWSRQHNDYVIDPERDGPRLRWSITTGGRWRSLHGDGVMLYPGKDGPIGCIRLENIRDGIEDTEYLWRLAQAEGSRKKARQAVLPVSENMTSFTRDPATLTKQRNAIARRILGSHLRY